MGCDIHDFVEVRRGGQWQMVKGAFTNPYYQPEHPTDPDGWNSPKFDHPVHERNYQVFTAMANVRRYGGFPLAIAEPRGVPDDITPDVLAEYTLRVVPPEEYDEDMSGMTLRENAERYARDLKCRWFSDDRIEHPDWHSASWLTLRELLAYPWTSGVGEWGSSVVTRALPEMQRLAVKRVPSSRHPPRKGNQHVTLPALFLRAAGISPDDVGFSAVAVYEKIAPQRGPPGRDHRALVLKNQRDLRVRRDSRCHGM
jgi:hypothetical protein